MSFREEAIEIINEYYIIGTKESKFKMYLVRYIQIGYYLIRGHVDSCPNATKYGYVASQYISYDIAQLKISLRKICNNAIKGKYQYKEVSNNHCTYYCRLYTDD